MNYRQNTEDIDFYKYWLILKLHWFPAISIFSFTVIIALIAAVSQAEVFRASGRLKFKKHNATSALVTETAEKIGQLETLKFINTPLDTEAEVIRSYPIVSQTIEALDLTDNEQERVTYEDFLKSLEIKNIPGTDVLLISYKSRDSQEAVKVVNQLMNIYQENNILVNRTEAAAAREFINQQLPKTEQSLTQAEVALRNFKESYNTVDLETESKLNVEQISELDSQIKQSEALLKRLSGRIVNLESKLGFKAEDVLSLNNINDSEAISFTITRLQEVSNQLAKEQSRFSDRNPIVMDLKAEKTSLEALLQKQIGSELGQSPKLGLVTRLYQTGAIQQNLAEQLISAEVERRELREEIASLQQSINESRQKASSIPVLEQTQRRLERQLDAAQSAYQALLNNLQQVLIAENQNVGNAQIINPAIASEYPVSTSKKLIVAMGIFAGGMLGAIAAFILEIIDPSIKTSKELRNLLDCTLLGIIPDSYKKVLVPGTETEWVSPERQIIDAPNSAISEAYKMLQANLKFLRPDEKLKIIVVTSSLPKEGKSTVSANLAGVLAELGNRVLLIDADLHRPQQHNIWKLDNDLGISNVVLYRDSWSQAIQSVATNIDVLPSGVIPPNALTLLESKQMDLLIESFQEIYDYIVVDTPPLLLFAEAMTLGKKADGILLVARPGVIDGENAKVAEDLLRKSGQNTFGLVVNGVVVENEPDSYFHHSKRYYQNDTNKKNKLKLPQF